MFQKHDLSSSKTKRNRSIFHASLNIVFRDLTNLVIKVIDGGHASGGRDAQIDASVTRMLRDHFDRVTSLRRKGCRQDLAREAHATFLYPEPGGEGSVSLFMVALPKAGRGW